MADMNSIQAELEALRAENAKLKARSGGRVSLKVSTKGAVSAYGLGRFPVTLYATQWTRLLDAAEAIKAFIVTNEGVLAKKEE